MLHCTALHSTEKYTTATTDNTTAGQTTQGKTKQHNDTKINTNEEQDIREVICMAAAAAAHKAQHDT